MAYDIEIYTPEMRNEWDFFVSEAKNATFLHYRGYMDYHSDRFHDFSIIARKRGKIAAILPANLCDDTIYSHQGLTYGGWLTSFKHFDAGDMVDLFGETIDFLKSRSIKSLVYRPAPHIYHKYPAEEDLYALFLNGAKLASSAISQTIQLGNAIQFNENARRAVKKAVSLGVEISESNDFAGYWKILNEVLAARHATKPVHSVQEILLLHYRFPKNIRLFTASLNGEIIAGTVVYDTATVAHAQYIAANDNGRDAKALPLLFKHLIENVFSEHRYFDFGISTENEGKILNRGLSAQKSGMGGRGIVYNSYELKI